MKWSANNNVNDNNNKNQQYYKCKIQCNIRWVRGESTERKLVCKFIFFFFETKPANNWIYMILWKPHTHRHTHAPTQHTQENIDYCA